MKVSIYAEDKHRTIIDDWWLGHEYPIVPAALLPSLGAVIYDDKGPLIAGWLMMSNSNGVSYIEYIVSNPDRPDAVFSAFSGLTSFLENQARRNNYGVVAVAIHDPSLVSLALRAGFQEPSKATILHKIL